MAPLPQGTLLISDLTPLKITAHDVVNRPHQYAFVSHFKKNQRQAVRCVRGVLRVCEEELNTLTSSTVSGMQMRYSFSNMVRRSWS